VIVFFGADFIKITEESKIFYLLISTKKLYILFDKKMDWTSFWTFFFKNSSGHPGSEEFTFLFISFDITETLLEMFAMTRGQCYYYFQRF
jgi:hypothetical protein